MSVTQEQPTQAQEPLDPERLSRGEYFHQVLFGVGEALGLGMLWLMEVVRDAFFHLLDRLNFKPRRRTRVSAFPPGRPRKRPPASASGAS